MYSYEMPKHNMHIYNRFEHTLVDRSDTVTLCSLKFAGVDWGSAQRFLEPIVNPDGTTAFTYEMKFAPALFTKLAATGWNRRPILIDLTTDKFQAGAWQPMPETPFKLESDFTKLSLFWKDVAGFTSPEIERSWNSILKVDDQGFEFKDWNDKVFINWNDITKIHFSKRAVNTLEVPNIEGEFKSGSRNHRMTLPQEGFHPFYEQLEKLNLIKKEDVIKFLDSQVATERLLLASLGGIAFQIDQGFAQAKAEPGMIVNGQLIRWQDITTDSAPLLNVQIGNLIIDQLQVHPGRTKNDQFPAQSFSFNFSKINQKEIASEMIEQVGMWAEKLESEAQVEFHSDWSQFFVLKNAILELRLSYSDSEGFGSFDLDPEFYRQLLAQQKQFQTTFAPKKNFSFKSKDIHVKDEYGFAKDQIFPTPDELRKPKLHFWDDDQEKMGLSDQGFLYVWNKSDLVDFHDEVSDEYGDRGGPYYESVLVFKNESKIRLSTGGEDIAAAKKFLLK